MRKELIKFLDIHRTVTGLHAPYMASLSPSARRGSGNINTARSLVESAGSECVTYRVQLHWSAAVQVWIPFSANGIL